MLVRHGFGVGMFALGKVPTSLNLTQTRIFRTTVSTRRIELCLGYMNSKQEFLSVLITCLSKASVL